MIKGGTAVPAVLNGQDLNDEVDFSRHGRATFIQELQNLVSGLENLIIEEPVETIDQPAATTEAELEQAGVESEEMEPALAEPAPAIDQATLQQTLDQGLQFLNGIFKMATGNSLLTENQTINIDADTGEVTIKFKLPKVSAVADQATGSS